MNITWDNLRLNKTIIGILALGIIIVLTYYHLFWTPRFTRLTVLNRIVPEKENKLREMQVIQREYQTFMAEHTGFDKPFIELLGDVASSLQLTEAIASLEPVELASTTQEETLRALLVFSNITFAQLIRFLEEVEKLPKAITILNLEITSNQERADSLSVSIEFQETILNL